ncbi:MAG TPA: mechanosensitive ion channel domain-containing protein [Halanaerobiales bacterium]|nr:mechanosensitive ion channel domain-containing protein [Halanaerobiales bacterium]
MINNLSFLSNFNGKYLYTFFVIIILIISRFIINKIIKYKVSNISKRYKSYKLNTYVTVSLAIIIIIPMWVNNFKSLFTFLGIFSAGLAIALRDVVINFFGWIYILSRRPFSSGDRIEIDGVKGDVIDIKLMEFTLMEVGNWVDAEQSTGRIVNIPNGKVLSMNTANFTKGFELIWNEITVLITFESDWKKAKSILNDIAQKNSLELNKNLKESIIHSARKNYQKLTPIVYTKVKSSGVALTIRYLCKPRKRRTTSEKFWENILDAFENEDEIQFAYKTYRNINPEITKFLNDRKREGEE